MIGYAEGTSTCYAPATSPCYAKTYDDPVLYVRTRESSPTVSSNDYLVKCYSSPGVASPFTFNAKANLQTLVGFSSAGNGSMTVGDSENAFTQLVPFNIAAQNFSKFPGFLHFDKNMNFVRAIGIAAIDGIRYKGTSFCAYPHTLGGLPQCVYAQFASDYSQTNAFVYPQIYKFDLIGAPTIETGVTFSGTSGHSMLFDIVQPTYEIAYDGPVIPGSTNTTSQGVPMGDSGVVYAYTSTNIRVTIPGNSTMYATPHGITSPQKFIGGTGLRFYSYVADGITATGNINPRLEMRSTDLQVSSSVSGDAAIKGAFGMAGNSVFRVVGVGGI